VIRMIDYRAAIESESASFYDTAERASPTRKVPGCPDWSVSDLVWHLAEVHHFWGSLIEQQVTSVDDLNSMDLAPRPQEYDELLAFGRDNVVRLIDILGNADPSTRVWTWSAQKDVAFIERHQVQEAAVHRWDMQSATPFGTAPIDGEIAADSIDEFLRLTLPAWRGEKPELLGTVTVRCTDVDREWLIDRDGTVLVSGGRSDLAVTGTSSDLLLALYQRIPLDGIDAVLGVVDVT